MPSLRRHRLLVGSFGFFSLLASGCHSSTDTPDELAVETSLRSGGTSTGGGAADAAAGTILLSTGAVAGWPSLTFTNTALRDGLERLGRDHLQAAGLTTGAGAAGAGSAYVRRLAADRKVSDKNGDGTNLDEVFAAELARYAEDVGGVVPVGWRPILFPWRDGNAEFVAAVDPQAPDQRTKDGVVGEVDMAQVGYAMLARLAVVSRLFRDGRNDGPGLTAQDGVLGMILLQQVIAMEETVFASLFVDGAALGGMPYPQDYDPAVEARQWLPRRFRVNTGAGGLPASYSLHDLTSDLSVLASMMRAGGLLAYVASPSSPNHALYRALHGLPFGPPPPLYPDTQSVNGGRIVTWEDGVSKLLAQWCVSCHPPRFGFNDFSVDTYENVLKGGKNSGPGSSTPIITRFEPDKSLLYNILLPNPPKSLSRMPLDGPYLDQKDTDLIKQWIVDGARSAPPAPPRIGIDLVVTMYKNLVAMHLGTDGDLFEQHDGTAPIAFANPAATGAALVALGSLATMRDELEDYDKTLQAAAEAAVQNLTRDTGEVFAVFRIEDGVSEGAADLLGHARMTAGLFAAARVLRNPSIRARADKLAERLLGAFFDADKGLFKAHVEQTAIRYTPVVIAAVVDALNEMGAVATAEKFLARLLPALVHSELAGGGEVLGDGIADTDGNGLKEPALAGGPFGRAPLFVGEILEGERSQLPTDTAVTWSKQIQPLFRQKCGECHMDGSTRGDGYLLDTPALAQVPIHSQNPMPLVVPFDPENSFLYRKLVDRNPTIGAQMPEARPPITDYAKELVRQWILQGASKR